MWCCITVIYQLVLFVEHDDNLWWLPFNPFFFFRIILNRAKTYVFEGSFSQMNVEKTFGCWKLLCISRNLKASSQIVNFCNEFEHHSKQRKQSVCCCCDFTVKFIRWLWLQWLDLGWELSLSLSLSLKIYVLIQRLEQSLLFTNQPVGNK